MAAVPQTKPMMTIQESVKTCVRKYADFSGRATRAEFWWWVLATMLVGFAIGTVDGAINALLAGGIGYGFSPLSSIFGLAVLLPDLAVTCRRLHDIGKSGWWQLAWFVIAFLGAIPLIAGVIIFVVSGFSGAKGWEMDEGSLVVMIVGIIVSLLIWLAIAIWWIVWLARQGDAGPNRFGEDPRSIEETEPAGDGLE